MAATLTTAAVALLAGCSVSGGGTASPPPPGASVSAAALPGTLVYAPPENNGKITLQVWPAGAAESKAAAALDSADVLASTTLSPDGTKIAYVHGTGAAAALTVAAIDGTGAKVLLTGVEPTCDEPNWFPDGHEGGGVGPSGRSPGRFGAGGRRPVRSVPDRRGRLSRGLVRRRLDHRLRHRHWHHSV